MVLLLGRLDLDPVFTTSGTVLCILHPIRMAIISAPSNGWGGVVAVEARVLVQGGGWSKGAHQDGWRVLGPRPPRSKKARHLGSYPPAFG